MTPLLVVSPGAFLLVFLGLPICLVNTVGRQQIHPPSPSDSCVLEASSCMRKPVGMSELCSSHAPGQQDLSCLFYNMQRNDCMVHPGVVAAYTHKSFSEYQRHKWSHWTKHGTILCLHGKLQGSLNTECSFLASSELLDIFCLAKKVLLMNPLDCFHVHA